jgi:hypothetical protein
MQQGDEGKTETYVQEYLRTVPHKYHRGPQRIDVQLDKNNEVLLMIRGKQFIIHVIDKEPKPTPAPQTLLQRILGR